MDKATTIRNAAAILGVDPSWLDNVIAFESGGNPKAQNPIPYNKASVDAGKDYPRYARGLIQFTDETAQWLGFTDSLDLVTTLPDFDTQMQGAVVPYFKKYLPYPTKQSFYMAVFYPAYRSKDPSTMFSDSVQAVNPGIRTVGDYINRVDTIAAGSRVLHAAEVGGAISLAVLLVGVAAYFFLMR